MEGGLRLARRECDDSGRVVVAVLPGMATTPGHQAPRCLLQAVSEGRLLKQAVGVEPMCRGYGGEVALLALPGRQCRQVNDSRADRHRLVSQLGEACFLACAIAPRAFSIAECVGFFRASYFWLSCV